MNKRIVFMTAAFLAVLGMSACGSNNAGSQSSSKTAPSTTSQGPRRSVSDLSISLGNVGDKAYITVTGTQVNYTADTFKWAWGLKKQDGNTFDDGKAVPDASDFQTATFDANDQFTVRYCLTDITTIKAGQLYRIYGGTPETYADIGFSSNMFGATDATRKYYLRQDVENSLVFENIQPIKYTLASVVEVSQSDLPTGVTQAGAYLKIGGTNTKNLTMDIINGWHTAGNIAGDFQRINPSYELHPHVDEERFWAIEGNSVFFYLYVGFIEESEGWMTHFDLVSGSEGSGLQTESVFNGERTYVANGGAYKIYSDTNKSGEENYWGCLGVYRVPSNQYYQAIKKLFSFEKGFYFVN